jgi:hypothetical protein
MLKIANRRLPGPHPWGLCKPFLGITTFLQLFGDASACPEGALFASGSKQKSRRSNQIEKSAITMMQSWKDLEFDAPAPYRIRVQGHLDDSWSDRLGGMVLTRAFTANNQPMTILIGQLNDQAALSGVMNALYNEHLPVLSVELLNESQH